MAYGVVISEDARIDIGALTRAIVGRLPRIMLATLVLLALTFIVLSFQTRLYQSSASILVEPRSASEQTSVVVTGNATGVVSSQIELIKSRDTLLSVIDQLDLRSVPEFNQGGVSPLRMIMQLFGRNASAPDSVDETVVRALSERLSVSQQGDSGIITVSVLSHDPQLAADITNAIAEAHVTRRAGLSIADTARTSDWLLNEIERLRASVVKAEGAVADFRVDNDLLVGQGTSSLLDQQLSTISGQISAARERRSTAEARAALIRRLIESGQPVEGLADVQSSPIIGQLSQEKARVQGELGQRSATLLPSHPTIRSLNGHVSAIDRQIRVESQRVAASLDAEAQIHADLETALRAQLDRAKSSAFTATRDTVTLASLEREAKAQRDLLEAYLLRYTEASSRVEANSALPDVRVVSVAAPSVTPASPKTTLVLVGVAIASIFVQIAIVAFSELMSGRALMSTSRPRQLDERNDVSFKSEREPGRHGYEPAAALDVDQAADAAQPTIADLEQQSGTTEPDPASIPMPKRRQVRRVVRYSDLVSDLAVGRTRLLLLADYGEEDSRATAERLVGDALENGLSVALVDAGTGRPTDHPGLTDLSDGTVSFGDVVQNSPDNTFAEITWGRGTSLDGASTRPLTLVEALGDIYEVVVVLTGPVETRSTLPYFAPLGGRIVLIAGEQADVDHADNARRTLAKSGFAGAQIIAMGDDLGSVQGMHPGPLRHEAQLDVR